jgi:glucose-6-phosphate-specific signal transduction histidine kinase
LIIPVAFMGYHASVYGLESVESWAVLLFGLEMTLAMIVLRDVTYVHVRHIANNLGILIFEAMDPTTFMITLMSSWVFWLLVLVVLGYLAFRVLRKRR